MKKLCTELIAAFIFCSIPLTVYAYEVYGSHDCFNGNQFKQTEKPDNFIKKQKNDNPDFIAYQYALENNISFEEAKNELRAKYGNPRKEQNGKYQINPLNLVPEEQQLLEAGIPLEVIKEGDGAIMNFILDNKISEFPQKKNI